VARDLNQTDEHGQLFLHVNSTHKQGIHIDDFNATFSSLTQAKTNRAFYISATALAEDGIVEAFEIRSLSGHLIWSGTQFHPEMNNISSFGHSSEDDNWAQTSLKFYQYLRQDIQHTVSHKSDVGPAMDDLMDYINTHNKMSQITSLALKKTTDPHDELELDSDNYPITHRP